MSKRRYLFKVQYLVRGSPGRSIQHWYEKRTGFYKEDEATAFAVKLRLLGKDGVKLLRWRAGRNEWVLA